MLKMLKRNRSRGRVNSDINVTPMADIMLVLLIIFMITTPMLQQNIALHLPKSPNPITTVAKVPFTLSLTQDGRIYLGNTCLTEQKMVQALSERFSFEMDKNIFLRADQSLAYGKVVHVIDECRKVGADRVGLMTEKETQK
jgi:biopolymer transport protein TolR